MYACKFCHWTGKNHGTFYSRRNIGWKRIHVETKKQTNSFLFSIILLVDWHSFDSNFIEWLDWILFFHLLRVYSNRIFHSQSIRMCLFAYFVANYLALSIVRKKSTYIPTTMWYTKKNVMKNEEKTTKKARCEIV